LSRDVIVEKLEASTLACAVIQTGLDQLELTLKEEEVHGRQTFQPS
jgi:hypothetical protein